MYVMTQDSLPIKTCITMKAVTEIDLTYNLVLSFE